LPKQNVKRQKKRRPKSAAAARSRIGHRRGKKSSSLAQFDTTDNVPETDCEFGLKKKQKQKQKQKQKRPQSAFSQVRTCQQTLDGSHMFQTKSNETLDKSQREILADTQKITVEERSKKKRVTEKRKTEKALLSRRKKQGIPKVTLLRLNETCRREDVAGVLKAMGLDDAGVDIRMTVVNPITQQRKARVYFRKSYADYKLAVSMLTIVQRSVDVSGTTSMFERIKQGMPGAPAKGSGGRTGGRLLKDVTAVSKIRVPKIMHPLSASQ
jgi:hypothetical protein